jgi:hypothetical protein
MDGRCCFGCKNPATHTFKNLETGYQDVMCEQHAKALDVRDQSKFLRIPTAGDEASEGSNERLPTPTAIASSKAAGYRSRRSTGAHRW